MNTLAISPAQRDALARWLDHLRALDGAAANTITAYAHDVTGFLAFLAVHHGESEGLKRHRQGRSIRSARVDGA